MNLPFGLLLFGLIFFLLLAVGFIIQAQRKQEKAYYIFAAVSLLFALAFVFIIIDLPQLVVVLMITVGPLSIIGLLKMLKVWKRKWTRLQRESDISAPMRGRDFLTMKGWLKLASRWGVRKTVFLYILLAMPISDGMFFILSLWVKRSMAYVVLETITFFIVSSIVFSVMLYQNLCRIAGIT